MRSYVLIHKTQAVKQNWDQTKSLNYKIKHLKEYQSVVYAKIVGNHGQVHTNNLERVYYILRGKGEFVIAKKTIPVKQGDVFTISPNTVYDYHALPDQSLEILLFMELWDN